MTYRTERIIEAHRRQRSARQLRVIKSVDGSARRPRSSLAVLSVIGAGLLLFTLGWFIAVVCG